MVVSIGLVRQAHTEETQTPMRSDATSPNKREKEKKMILNPYKARCRGLWPLQWRQARYSFPSPLIFLTNLSWKTHFLKRNEKAEVIRGLHSII